MWPKLRRYLHETIGGRNPRLSLVLHLHSVPPLWYHFRESFAMAHLAAPLVLLRSTNNLWGGLIIRSTLDSSTIFDAVRRTAQIQRFYCRVGFVQLRCTKLSKPRSLRPLCGVCRTKHCGHSAGFARPRLISALLVGIRWWVPLRFAIGSRSDRATRERSAKRQPIGHQKKGRICRVAPDAGPFGTAII